MTELSRSIIHMNLCSIPRETNTCSTLGSITNTAGTKATTAIGAIYSIKFIEFNFSLNKVNCYSIYTHINQKLAYNYTKLIGNICFETKQYAYFHFRWAEDL